MVRSQEVLLRSVSILEFSVHSFFKWHTCVCPPGCGAPEVHSSVRRLVQKAHLRAVMHLPLSATLRQINRPDAHFGRSCQDKKNCVRQQRHGDNDDTDEACKRGCNFETSVSCVRKNSGQGSSSEVPSSVHLSLSFFEVRARFTSPARYSPTPMTHAGSLAFVLRLAVMTSLWRKASGDVRFIPRIIRTDVGPDLRISGELLWLEHAHDPRVGIFVCGASPRSRPGSPTSICASVRREGTRVPFPDLVKGVAKDFSSISSCSTQVSHFTQSFSVASRTLSQAACSSQPTCHDLACSMQAPPCPQTSPNKPPAPWFLTSLEFDRHHSLCAAPRRQCSCAASRSVHQAARCQVPSHPSAGPQEPVVAQRCPSAVTRC